MSYFDSETYPRNVETCATSRDTQASFHQDHLVCFATNFFALRDR